MSPHEKIPSDLGAERIIRALVRLGFVLDRKGGKGSHVKLTWRNEKFVTVQYHLHKTALKELLKEVENISGLTWAEIKEEI